MAAAIDIANGALNAIGADSIVALTDANKRALACLGQYDLSRREELRGANWSFAIKRAMLAVEGRDVADLKHRALQDRPG